jgi:hypothetical protein
VPRGSRRKKQTSNQNLYAKLALPCSMAEQLNRLRFEICEISEIWGAFVAAGLLCGADHCVFQ